MHFNLLQLFDAQRVKYHGRPFARGFVKEVWLGELDGMPLVVKRAAGADNESLAIFDTMMTKEIDLARQLRLTPFVMNYLGACRGIEVSSSFCFGVGLFFHKK